MAKRELELSNKIEKLLINENIVFDREIAIGGHQADFLVSAPDNRKILIEVKAWDQFKGYRNRAAHQSSLFKDTLGVDEAFIVVDKLERSSIQEGVVTLDKLIPTIKNELSKYEPSNRKTKKISRQRKKHVFAAMPFNEKFDDVFLVAMTYAAEKNNSICKRIDKLEFSGDIVLEIQNQIESSVAVIADLSGSNPNVLYEVGFAHAIGRPTIHICSTPLEDLPFDVSHWNTIRYSVGQTFQLREVLANRLTNELGS